MIVESGLDVPNANTMVVHDAAPLRPGAALPAPRPRRPEPPPRLLLPAGARHDRRRRRGAARRCSSIIPTSARATGSRSRTWSSAAPATCSVPSSRATRRRSGSTSTCAGSRRRCGRSGGRADDGAARAARRGARPSRRICRTATCPTTTSKLDLYRRLARARSVLATLMGFATNCASASGPCRPRRRRCSTWRGSASWAPALGLQHVLVRGDEARLTFRPGRTPRLAGLTSALDDVQLAADVRRTVPLSLRLLRLGGEPIVPALVRALTAVSADL